MPVPRHARPGSGPRWPAAALAAVAVALLAATVVTVTGRSPTSEAAGAPSPGATAARDPARLEGPDPAPLGADPITERTVVLQGSGWGHSVGMSQYGAQAQALEGRSYHDILGHYYPGTDVTGDEAADETIRVHLFRNRPQIDATRLVLATSSVDGQPPESDVVVDLRAGEPVAVPFPQRWDIRVDAGTGEFVLRDSDGGERARGPGPALVHYELRGGTLLRLPQLAAAPRTRVAGTFRHGVLEVTAAGTRLNPVVVLPVELYLGGLAEVPSGWHVEALKAQAVAGRTYAVRRVRAGVDAACRCHLDSTPHDQVFTGWEKEGHWRGEYWRRAVRETAGEVVTYEGDLAWTYYSSSHGGATEDSGQSWAYGETLPYLRSVEDPWSAHPAVRNPYARWERRIPSQEFARAVGLADVSSVEITERTPGGTPLELLIEGQDAAGDDVSARYRGLEHGIAGSALKLAFRELLPSQQLSAITVVDP
jgi:stage II sporulation protein D